MARRSRSRDYPRTARLNEPLREIIAEALERIDDDRLPLVTVTSVDVDADLKRAIVYIASLDEDADDETLEALGEARIRLQGAVAREARRRRFGVSPPGDYAGRARQARFLQYRGFTHEQIRAALGPGEDIEP